MTTPRIAERGRAALIDPYATEPFEFQFAPKVLTFDKRTEISSSVVPGESLPRHAPSAGGSNKLTIQTTFQVMDRDVYNEDWLDEQAMWLKSLGHTRIVNEATGVRTLTPVLFIMGDFIELPIYVLSVRTTFGNLQPKSLRPHTLQVQMDVEETSLGEWVDAYGARKGKGHRRKSLFASSAEGSFSEVNVFDTTRDNRGRRSNFDDPTVAFVRNG